jgi:hypothetical protein
MNEALVATAVRAATMTSKRSPLWRVSAAGFACASLIEPGPLYLRWMEERYRHEQNKAGHDVV